MNPTPADANDYWAEFGALVLSLHQQLKDRSGSDIAAAFYNLAGIFAASKKVTEAEFLYLRAIDLWQKSYEIDFPFTFTSVKHLADKFRDKHVERTQPVIAGSETFEAEPLAA